ncbi:MAG: hypothetical protein ACRD25_03155 [Terracidiphilus sp.]
MSNSPVNEKAQGLIKRASRIGRKMQGEVGCSMPGCHDRLAEGRYFLDRMLATYHSPEEFRWNTHAFLQAINSFVSIGGIESQGVDEFQLFRAALNGLTAQETWKKLNKLRGQIVHKEPLLANASMLIGMYRYEKLKLAFSVPIPMYLPSWMAIARSRNDLAFVPAHREWCGEEIGLERIWRIPGFDDEIAKLSADALAKCDEVMHLSPGHEGIEGICTCLDTVSPRLLFEHDIFPEVLPAMDGENPEKLRARVDTNLWLLPDREEEVLHKITEGSEIAAWLNPKMTWNSGFSSLLLYSINGEVIVRNTAGFYLKAAFAKQESCKAQGDPGVQQ